MLRTCVHDSTSCHLTTLVSATGFGVRELTGSLDLSNNFISDSNFLFVHELGQLDCAGWLSVENNLIDHIDNESIQGELAAKWSSCSSRL